MKKLWNQQLSNQQHSFGKVKLTQKTEGPRNPGGMPVILKKDRKSKYWKKFWIIHFKPTTPKLVDAKIP